MADNYLERSTDEELVNLIGQRHPHDAPAQGAQAMLALRASRAAAEASRQLVTGTDRLARATWALVGVTVLLTISAIVQAVAMFRCR